MRTLDLSDASVVLSNVAVLVSSISDIISEIDRDKVTPPIWEELSRAQALLSIAQNACEDAVQAIEAGPDYVQAGGRS